MATVNEKMTAIADAIRKWSFIEDLQRPLTLDDMASSVPKVYNAGYEVGRFDGETIGIEMGIETGRQETVSNFWDIYQDEGKRRNYWGAFSAGWNDQLFNPKYEIIANVTNYMFKDSIITNIPKITITAGSIAQVFYNATKLVMIGELVLTSKNQSWVQAFFNCSSLENLKINGEIDGNGFDVSVCTKLTKDSIFGKVATEEQIANGEHLIELNGTQYYGGIISSLKDYSGSGTTRAITLGYTNLAKLTDEEKAIATQKGWTLA